MSDQNWLQSRQFPFSVQCTINIPETYHIPSIALISTNRAETFKFNLVNHIPFLCYGEASTIGHAFLFGAKDFIRYPFDEDELKARISRLLFVNREIEFPEYAVSLHGNTLYGPAGAIELNDDEVCILKILEVSENHRIHKRIIKEHIHPELQPNSRSIDMMISRLRHKLKVISDQNKPLQIKTIYGFGYQID
ncbi:winged helix-turn-helix domain-containing protein [Gracilinema caldarium]|uniref:Response regulator receiver protein n=1 Tax=Gracilinema caldarium (strain ATCC 51460 / DSM 7334 / H1) TaxID=744872 RepID=F8EYG5_GRAC1|nr:winged helix-turn-helix domain-containing protein [Gracilinema caldarium]AEJ18397.1 response regulator receiver protein [Gracilinema caldarium DSM 7334]